MAIRIKLFFTYIFQCLKLHVILILMTTNNKSKDLGETRPRNVLDRNQKSWSQQRDTHLGISITNNHPSGKTNTLNFIESIWSTHYIGRRNKTSAHIMYLNSSQQRNLYFTTVIYVWKIYDLKMSFYMYSNILKLLKSALSLHR